MKKYLKAKRVLKERCDGFTQAKAPARGSSKLLKHALNWFWAPPRLSPQNSLYPETGATPIFLLCELPVCVLSMRIPNIQ